MNDNALEKNYPCVYEVNLTIELDLYEANKSWLISHFHEMVVENNFKALKLFIVRNTDPIDDSHLRYQKLVAQYFVSSHEQLQIYFEKQAKRMRSQVIEKLGCHYTVSRRVYELIEKFEGKPL